MRGGIAQPSVESIEAKLYQREIERSDVRESNSWTSRPAFMALTRATARYAACNSSRITRRSASSVNGSLLDASRSAALMRVW